MASLNIPVSEMEEFPASLTVFFAHDPLTYNFILQSRKKSLNASSTASGFVRATSLME